MCSRPVDLSVAGAGERWRIWSPEDASSGAVPFHDAKWPLVGTW
jgi:hypothetical protein